MNRKKLLIIGGAVLLVLVVIIILILPKEKQQTLSIGEITMAKGVTSDDKPVFNLPY